MTGTALVWLVVWLAAGRAGAEVCAGRGSVRGHADVQARCTANGQTYALTPASLSGGRVGHFQNMTAVHLMRQHVQRLTRRKRSLWSAAFAADGLPCAEGRCGGRPDLPDHQQLQCCQPETSVLLPLSATSSVTKRRVQIVQSPPLHVQPVLVSACQSDRCPVTNVSCHQMYAPQILVKLSGRRLQFDMVYVESGCLCGSPDGATVASTTQEGPSMTLLSPTQSSSHLPGGVSPEIAATEGRNALSLEVTATEASSPLPPEIAAAEERDALSLEVTATEASDPLPAEIVAAEERDALSLEVTATEASDPLPAEIVAAEERDALSLVTATEASISLPPEVAARMWVQTETAAPRLDQLVSQFEVPPTADIGSEMAETADVGVGSAPPGDVVGPDSELSAGAAPTPESVRSPRVVQPDSGELATSAASSQSPRSPSKTTDATLDRAPATTAPLPLAESESVATTEDSPVVTAGPAKSTAQAVHEVTESAGAAAAPVEARRNDSDATTASDATPPAGDRSDRLETAVRLVRRTMENERAALEALYDRQLRLLDQQLDERQEAIRHSFDRELEMLQEIVRSLGLPGLQGPPVTEVGSTSDDVSVPVTADTEANRIANVVPAKDPANVDYIISLPVRGNDSGDDDPTNAVNEVNTSAKNNSEASRDSVTLPSTSLLPAHPPECKLAEDDNDHEKIMEQLNVLVRVLFDIGLKFFSSYRPEEPLPRATAALPRTASAGSPASMRLEQKLHYVSGSASRFSFALDDLERQLAHVHQMRRLLRLGLGGPPLEPLQFDFHLPQATAAMLRCFVEPLPDFRLVGNLTANFSPLPVEPMSVRLQRGGGTTRALTLRVVSIVGDLWSDWRFLLNNILRSATVVEQRERQNVLMLSRSDLTAGLHAALTALNATERQQLAAERAALVEGSVELQFAISEVEKLLTALVDIANLLLTTEVTREKRQVSESGPPAVISHMSRALFGSLRCFLRGLAGAEEEEEQGGLVATVIKTHASAELPSTSFLPAHPPECKLVEDDNDHQKIMEQLNVLVRVLFDIGLKFFSSYRPEEPLPRATAALPRTASAGSPASMRLEQKLHYVSGSASRFSFALDDLERQLAHVHQMRRLLRLGLGGPPLEPLQFDFHLPQATAAMLRCFVEPLPDFRLVGNLTANFSPLPVEPMSVRLQRDGGATRALTLRVVSIVGDLWSDWRFLLNDILRPATVVEQRERQSVLMLSRSDLTAGLHAALTGSVELQFAISEVEKLLTALVDIANLLLTTEVTREKRQVSESGPPAVIGRMSRALFGSLRCFLRGLAGAEEEGHADVQARCTANGQTYALTPASLSGGRVGQFKNMTAVHLMRQHVQRLTRRKRSLWSATFAADGLPCAEGRCGGRPDLPDHQQLQCCQPETSVLLPLSATSSVTKRRVQIVQSPPLHVQPVLVSACQSDRCPVTNVSCHQMYAPQILVKLSGRRLQFDMVYVESGCLCGSPDGATVASATQEGPSMTLLSPTQSSSHLPGGGSPEIAATEGRNALSLEVTATEASDPLPPEIAAAEERDALSLEVTATEASDPLPAEIVAAEERDALSLVTATEASISLPPEVAARMWVQTETAAPRLDQLVSQFEVPPTADIGSEMAETADVGVGSAPPGDVVGPDSELSAGAAPTPESVRSPRVVQPDSGELATSAASSQSPRSPSKTTDATLDRAPATTAPLPLAESESVATTEDSPVVTAGPAKSTAQAVHEVTESAGAAAAPVEARRNDSDATTASDATPPAGDRSDRLETAVRLVRRTMENERAALEALYDRQLRLLDQQLDERQEAIRHSFDRELEMLQEIVRSLGLPGLQGPPVTEVGSTSDDVSVPVTADTEANRIANVVPAKDPANVDYIISLPVRGNDSGDDDPTNAVNEVNTSAKNNSEASRDSVTLPSTSLLPAHPPECKLAEDDNDHQKIMEQLNVLVRVLFDIGLKFFSSYRPEEPLPRATAALPRTASAGSPASMRLEQKLHYVSGSASRFSFALDDLERQLAHVHQMRRLLRLGLGGPPLEPLQFDFHLPQATAAMLRCFVEPLPDFRLVGNLTANFSPLPVEPMSVRLQRGGGTTRALTLRVVSIVGDLWSDWRFLLNNILRSATVVEQRERQNVLMLSRSDLTAGLHAALTALNATERQQLAAERAALVEGSVELQFAISEVEKLLTALVDIANLLLTTEVTREKRQVSESGPPAVISHMSRALFGSLRCFLRGLAGAEEEEEQGGLVATVIKTHASAELPSTSFLPAHPPECKLVEDDNDHQKIMEQLNVLVRVLFDIGLKFFSSYRPEEPLPRATAALPRTASAGSPASMRLEQKLHYVSGSASRFSFALDDLERQLAHVHQMRRLLRLGLGGPPLEPLQFDFHLPQATAAMLRCFVEPLPDFRLVGNLTANFSPLPVEPMSVRLQRDGGATRALTLRVVSIVGDLWSDWRFLLNDILRPATVVEQRERQSVLMLSRSDLTAGLHAALTGSVELQFAISEVEKLLTALVDIANLLLTTEVTREKRQVSESGPPAVIGHMSRALPVVVSDDSFLSDEDALMLEEILSR
ncbi:uncharacterized protein LOC119103130 [Pollicipes pollicipes]|uniref:uncharacterized protein LOC119103130 n=1 Tax=Pollicipes pollicipes TaxID=41117 RepID=UPI0018858E19|nr:uncharacterized protein LOC119103130 [Pollicipes pollicipes]